MGGAGVLVKSHVGIIPSPLHDVFADLADEANKLVKGDYREGFTIPEVV